MAAGDTGGDGSYLDDEPALRSATRFLRVVTTITRLVDELNAGSLTLDEAARARLMHMYGGFIDDLRDALSAHMYAELRRLVRIPRPEPGARELRLAYVELLGWLRGVPLEIVVEVPAITSPRARRGADGEAGRARGTAARRRRRGADMTWW